VTPNPSRLCLTSRYIYPFVNCSSFEDKNSNFSGEFQIFSSKNLLTNSKIFSLSFIGTGKYKIIWALGVMFIPSFARIVRSEVMRCKSLEFVKSAKVMGAGNLRIIFVHIIPNTAVSMLTAAAIGFNNAVLAEASMSYLGLGVQPPEPSLGLMLSQAQAYIFNAPWYAICPGITIVLIILGFSLISEGLRSYTD
jgi:peptide/nickel transport system permease protein